ncbi:MAG TPA: anthranilate phosphoribosyltransferase [Gemmataceae bacterium]|jgi:anthranilate phosphoribosyltransferase|nr:anthranilate phosphoribosyltransferase [Gemmataceae bacterium]
MSSIATNVQENPPVVLANLLAILAERRPMAEDLMRAAMREMMAGAWDEGQIASFLSELRKKGETGEEIAAAASILRENMVRLDTGPVKALDTCGTGGDGLGTFNISTAAALVAAGAGVPVVKHGNRASTGRTGSADVLAALGLEVDSDSTFAKRCLEQSGFAFCFAPRFHPAMRHVVSARRRLGFRTLFNCLGPLANPAGACYQLIGVGHLDWLDPMADAVNRLGTRRALLVYGRDGMDEVSLAAPTSVREVQNGQVASWEWTASDFGLAPCSLEELKSEGARESADRILAILHGEDSPAARVVLANASAALLAAGRAETPVQGVDLARDAIKTGKAHRVLERLLACSKK